MDMEQRTSLLMDWCFLGREDFLKVQFHPENVTIFLSIFVKCVSTYPKFPIEFLYDEIIVFSGKSDSKEMLIYTCTHVENYVCDISHSQLAAAYSGGNRGGTGLRFESK